VIVDVRAPHIEAETLYRLAAGELPETARDDALRHVATCAACRTELELARSFTSVNPGTRLGDRSGRLRAEFHRRLEAAATPRPVVRRPRRRRWAAGALLAASLGLITVTVVLVLPRHETGKIGANYRAPGSAPRIAVTAVAGPDGLNVSWTLPPSWSRHGENTGIVVAVLDEAGQVVLEVRQPTSPVTIPREAVGSVEGNLAFVRVTASLTSGETVSSEPVPVRLDR
jgi:anti-sigma factor RsiW